MDSNAGRWTSFIAERVADRLADATRIHGAEIDQRAQDVRARDPVASLRAQVFQVARGVDHDAVQLVIVAAAGGDEVDGIGVRP